MDSPHADHNNLIPLTLLSTSVFQRAKRNPPASASQPAPTACIASPAQVSVAPEALDRETPTAVKKEPSEKATLATAADESQSQALIVRSEASTNMPAASRLEQEGPGMPRRGSGSSRTGRDEGADTERGRHGTMGYDSHHGEWRQGNYRSWRDRDSRYAPGDRPDWDQRPPYGQPYSQEQRRLSSRQGMGDPFVQGQSRYGRDYYEGTSRRSYDANMDERYGPADMMQFHQRHDNGRSQFTNPAPNKRRNESTSPEPRKRTAAGSGGEDREPRTRHAGATMDISPGTSPYAGSVQTISSLSSPGSEAPPVKDRVSRKANDGTAPSPGRAKSTSRKSSSKASSSKSHKSLKKKNNKGHGSSSSSSASDSDSDSSSDSEDSEDSDVEDMRLAGSSDLKLHGVVSDLMLELERTRTKHAKYCEKVKTSSRKIRNILKSIQKRLRDLHDRAAVDTTTPARPSMTSRRNTTEKPGPTLPATAKSSQQQSTAASSSAPTSVSAAPPRKRRASMSGTSAHRNESVAVASRAVVETLTNVLADVRKGAFSRKPRSMILHSAVAGPDMEEVMVTSALDGSINFWDLENRRVMSTIHKNAISQPWAEDVCWVGRNVLAVASATKDGVSNKHQMTLVHVAKGKPQRSALGLNGPSLAWTLQSLDQKPHDSSKGGITCIASIAEDASGISLATAALDKQIVNWKFAPQNSDGDCVPIQQRLIHNKHTNSIQALCYAQHSHTLFSGGSDCKVVGWDMPRSEVVVEYKNTERGRVTAVMQNPVDPNLFLVCHAATDNQLSLHDHRQRFDNAVLRFGFPCADNLSKLVVPSWHPGGAIVSCGTQSEPKINIWDIRWKDVQRGAGQSIDVHDKRVFKAAFHPKRSFMTSMSADSSLAFIDFRLNPDTVVHS
ncbi:hypothetical protein BGZ75_002282 [Mortierella antarctica]|nr:hypothetical protein BGZ75_002282 [Mortierella antarctica]